MRTRIKFCGLTRAEDVIFAARLGVDALGFVLVPGSKRWVSAEHAAALLHCIGPLAHSVGLFQNAPAEQVRAALKIAPFSLLQFHGDEDADYCSSFGLPYWKAVPMADRPSLSYCANAFRSAQALLLDSHSSLQKPISNTPHVAGGTGLSFDWNLIPDPAGAQGLPVPMVLAGGLKSETVGAAILRCKPYAVDVSSGIEASAGIKDFDKMRAFVRAVACADQAANAQHPQ